MAMDAFISKSPTPSWTGWTVEARKEGEGAGRVAGIAKNAGPLASDHCHGRRQSMALTLGRLGGVGGLERRPLGNRVVPGGELGCGGPPVGAVAPVVVAAGDG